MSPHHRLNCTAAQRCHDCARTAVYLRKSCDRIKEGLLDLRRRSIFDLGHAEVALRTRGKSNRAKKPSIPAKSTQPGFRQYRETLTRRIPVRSLGFGKLGIQSSFVLFPNRSCSCNCVENRWILSANTSKSHFRDAWLTDRITVAIFDYKAEKSSFIWSATTLWSYPESCG